MTRIVGNYLQAPDTHGTLSCELAVLLASAGQGQEQLEGEARYPRSPLWSTWLSFWRPIDIGI